jgi:hypothetical protein
MAEALISLSLLAVLASLMQPMLTLNVGRQRLLNVAQNTAAEIVRGYDTYMEENTAAATTSSQDIINNMNILRIINDGSLGTQDGLGVNTPCDATTPCALMHNGSMIQFLPGATFGLPDVATGMRRKALRFTIDIDGPDPANQPRLTLVLFYPGRLTTRGMAIAPNAVPIFNESAAPDTLNPALPDETSDPEYVYPWING